MTDEADEYTREEHRRHARILSLGAIASALAGAGFLALAWWQRRGGRAWKLELILCAIVLGVNAFLMARDASAVASSVE
ncbi:hypothetical protein BH11MYX1_BH11MYX1_22610 [soil metagenome]